MAIIKCKMCGGDLNVLEDATVCECEYCGTKQTVPKADDEKKLTLFARAGRLLRACEFDKAAGVFETIVADFPDEAEAYWGLVLCKYGIEYVDDPATGKKIPTCHRSSFDSVMKDANFEQACENTDAVARRVYRDEARAIEELRKSIIEVSDKEEPYDVFISYKEKDANGERTKDSVIAQEIYRELTREGYRVFFSRISLEDKLGVEYEPYIFAALNSARVMIVVGTDYENFDAVWVKNEWSRYLKLIAKGERKTLIPVFRDMDAYDMPEEFNKLTALDYGKVGAVQDLVRGVEKLVGKKKVDSTPAQTPVYVNNEADAKTAAAVKRGRLALENGEFDKAKEYYDQALTLDAECAEAYFGMALAQAQCRTAEEYAKRAVNQTPEGKTLSIKQYDDHIQSIVEQYSIPNFLDAPEIRQHYTGRIDLSYHSVVDGRKAILEKTKKEFESNRNITLAYRFANGSYQKTLNDFKNSLYAALEQKVRKAEQEEQVTVAQKQAEYRAFLKETDKEIEELNRKKQKEREEKYQKTCELYKTAKTSGQFASAKKGFSLLEDYKDSRILAEEAGRQKKEKETTEQKKKTKSIIIIGSVVAVAIAVLLIITNVIIPNKQYKEAEALFEAGQYEEAIAAFEAMDGYKDSANKIKEANDAIIAPKYAAADALFKEGKYEEAITAFEALGDFKDSGNRVLETRYALAEAYLESEQYESALSVFVVLDDYMDSQERIKETYYQWAGALIKTEQYEEAISILQPMEEYKDCRSLIADSQMAIAEKLLKTNQQGAAAIAFGKLGNYKDAMERSFAIWNQFAQRETISAGLYHTVGLRNDGTVIAVGDNKNGQCNVSKWTDIIAVSAGDNHTVGLRSDGTVVSTRSEGDISKWKNIVAISA